MELDNAAGADPTGMSAVDEAAAGTAVSSAVMRAGAAAATSYSAASSRTPSLFGLHAVQALHERITGLHRLRGRQTAPTTKTTVTREKNKLIIKQQPAQQTSALAAAGISDAGGADGDIYDCFFYIFFYCCPFNYHACQCICSTKLKKIQIAILFIYFLFIVIVRLPS